MNNVVSNKKNVVSGSLRLDDPVAMIRGVGPQKAAALHKAGIYNVMDLLSKRPLHVHELSVISSLDEINDADAHYIVQLSIDQVKNINRPGAPTIVEAYDAAGHLCEIRLFRMKHNIVQYIYPVGKSIWVKGQFRHFRGVYQTIHPKKLRDADYQDGIPVQELQYSSTGGIKPDEMRNLIGYALMHLKLDSVDEWLSPELQKQWSFEMGLGGQNLSMPNFINAIKLLHDTDKNNDKSKDHHQPHHQDTTYFEAARKRLAIDEVLADMLSVRIARKKQQQSKKAPSMGQKMDLYQTLLNNLPFHLTNAQEKALIEVKNNIAEKQPMLCLLQGDVGAGKTVVCFLAACLAIDAGFQAAVMAPTDILARQHFEEAKKLFKGMDINIILLTGQDTGKKRKSIEEDIKTGRANLVIGTHALFQDSVDYHRLGFVVIDEQHRFGVEQRLKLSQKAASSLQVFDDLSQEKDPHPVHHSPVAAIPSPSTGHQKERLYQPHMLLMSATPIPRTLLMTHYGDVDVSIIDEKPADRKPVITTILSGKKFEQLAQKMHSLIEKGQKIYWVCPLIDESETLNLTTTTDRSQALTRFFPPEMIGHVHGQLHKDNKQKIMDDFIDPKGKTKILVATTVIEVGVNVGNATLMIIEHAERYGLAQLHQLRGRVGRSSLQSYAILLYGDELSETGKKRLSMMRDSQDGFYLAEQDLLLRGGGEIIGKIQSGLPSYRFFDPEKDIKILEAISNWVDCYIEHEMHQNHDLTSRLKQLLTVFRCQYQWDYVLS